VFGALTQGCASLSLGYHMLGFQPIGIEWSTTDGRMASAVRRLLFPEWDGWDLWDEWRERIGWSVVEKWQFTKGVDCVRKCFALSELGHFGGALTQGCASLSLG